MSAIESEDIIYEGSIEKKSKHSDSYKKRAGVLSKDTFYVFKKLKRYINALDRIAFEKIQSIILPTDKDKNNLFIIIDKDNNEYYFKSDNRQKYADIIKENCSNIQISDIPYNNNENEIAENNVIIDEIDTEMLNMASFDIGLLNYNTNTNPTPTDVEYDNNDLTDNTIIEEIDFYIIDLINGYLRKLSNQSKICINNTMETPQNIQNICTLFYFIRKFDTRRLRPDCDF